MKRLFIAVTPDEATRTRIAELSASLRSLVNIRASWVPADRLHLTLFFFAHAPAVLEQRLYAALGAPLDLPPFLLSFGGLGVFPERGRPRVLWLGIREGAEALAVLQATLARRIGRPPEASFRPHLTLARLRDRMDRPAIAPVLGLPAAAGPCTIDRVTLYESRLSPSGPTHLAAAEGRLQP